MTNAYIAGTNLLSTVTGSDGEVYASISNYTPSGKIGTLVHDNGAVTTHTYNAYATRLTDIVTVKGTTLQNRHYTYTNSGDIASVIDSVAGVTYNYTYDDLHRLTDETNTGGFGAMHVTYNAIGNITQKSVGSNTFYIGYDSSHKHAVDYVNYNSTNYDYTYDANGNMTQGYDFTNPASIQIRTITYNVDNMTTSIYHGSGTTAALLYDGAGARAKKTVTGGSSSTTYYIGAHFEVKNGATTKYIFAGNLRVAQMVGSTRSYFHKDHLGSSTLMTDASGSLLESTNYEPFGGRRAHTGTDTSAYKFTDQEFDAESGLYNYDARMYDPVIGRFISPDSIVPDLYNPQSLNRYSYCLNNPLIYVDPTGNAEESPQKGYWERVGQNIKITNEFLPGIFAPAFDIQRYIPGLDRIPESLDKYIPGPSTWWLTAGKMAKAMDGITPLRWILSGMRGAALGGTAFTGLETGLIATSVGTMNWLAVAAFWETGVIVGSMIEAAIWTQEPYTIPESPDGSGEFLMSEIVVTGKSNSKNSASLFTSDDFNISPLIASPGCLELALRDYYSGYGDPLLKGLLMGPMFANAMAWQLQQQQYNESTP